MAYMKQFQDQMTPNERLKALALNQNVDRVPVYAFAGPAFAKYYGYSGVVYSNNPAAQADAQIRGFREFGFDNARIGIDYSLGICLGAEYKYSSDGCRVIHKKPLQRLEQVESLDLESVDIRHDIIASRAMETLKIMREEIGDEVNCSISLRAPFSAASGLVDITLMLRAMKRYPEKLIPLLDFCTQAQIQLAESFLKEGFQVSYSDGTASCTLISPDDYHHYALPCEQKIISACNRYGNEDSVLHICGNAAQILSYIPETGIRTFSVEEQVDLLEAKETIGDKIRLIGNVSSVMQLMQGTPESICAAIDECIQKAADSPMGFSIATGCDLCRETPIENLRIFTNYSKLCAQKQADGIR